MATTGSPLGIGLSVDFARLDADLSKVADKIDKVGANTQLKVGTLSGLAGPGGIDIDQLASQVGQIGTSLSQGMASGVGTTNALLLGMASRINATLEQMANAMLTMFTRIDVVMKGHRWTNMLTGLSNSLGNFAAGAGKKLSPLDKALGGAFGASAGIASAVLNTMFGNLGDAMTKQMQTSANRVGKVMAAAAKRIDTSMKDAMKSIGGAVKSLADTMSDSMTRAINQIAVKLGGLRAQTEGAAGGLKGVGVARPYVRQPAPPKKEEPIADEGAKIKPPSQAAVTKFFRQIGAMGPSEIDLFEKTKIKLPQSLAKMDFKGAMPKPQMFKEFQSIIKDTVVGIKNIPVAFQAAVASGNQYAITAMMVGKAFLTADRMATNLFNGIVRIGAGFAAMQLAAAAAFGRSISFFSSLGSVGKVTYGELFRGNNIFVAAVLSSVKTVYHLTRGLFDLLTLRAFRRVGDDAKQFGSAVQTATGFMGRLTSSVGRLGVEMAAAFGLVGLVYKTVQFFQKGVKSSADLNAEVARSKVVFGDSFGPVAEQVEKNTKAFNISKAAQMELTSSFGSMAQGAGVSEAKSADLATELNSLAIGMTGLGVSFNEASEAMKTGLSGRAISLKQFAVNIDDNTTKAFAWKTGIAAAGQELTMQETILSRAGQMMRGLSYAQDALTAGANSAAVQFQRAGGGMGVFAEKIGEILLPSVTSATKGFNTLLGGVLNMAGAAGPKIQEWSMSASGVVDTFIEKTQEFGPTILENLTWAWAEAKKGPLGFVIEGAEAIINFAKAIPEAIGIAVRNMGTLWEIAKLRVGDFVDNAIAYFNTIPANFQIMFPWLLRNWQNILVDIGNMINAFMDSLGKNIKDLATGIWDWLNGKEFTFNFTPLLDGFKATTEQLPELIKPAIASSQAEIDKLYAKIGEDELKFKKKTEADTAAISGKKPPILPEDKSKEYKLGGALESGTKEAFSALAKGQSGRSSTTDAVKQGITVQREHLAISKQQLAAMQNSAKTPLIAIK